MKRRAHTNAQLHLPKTRCDGARLVCRINSKQGPTNARSVFVGFVKINNASIMYDFFCVRCVVTVAAVLRAETE